MSTRVLDVSHLPPVAQGPRVTIWWGVLSLIAIEATVFGLMVAAYFYLRQNFAQWPPIGTPPPSLLPGTVNVALLLISLVPMLFVDFSARSEARLPVAVGLTVCTIIGIACFVLRVLEFHAMHCRWDSHAYGSVVWTILGMHAGHLVASTIENALLVALMLRGYVERKHFTDTNVNALYWYFVVLGWLPMYVIIYFAPRVP
jgi:heme/copper-type cytochrome/quinol oxidase subunit 3